MKLKVMTYNIMSGRNNLELMAGKDWLDPAIVNPSLVAEVIKEQNADIVGMNEVHEAGFIFDDQPERIAKESGYDYFYFAQAVLDRESPYGNAILSKYPIVEAETFCIPAGDPSEDERVEPRSIAKAIVDLGEQKVTVLVSHFGLAPSEQKMVVEKVKELIAASSYPCILMGDFNMEPDEKLIRELSALIQDTAPEKIDKTQYTFSSNDPFMKIDYIFADESMKVEQAMPIEANPSDHKPYVAELIL